MSALLLKKLLLHKGNNPKLWVALVTLFIGTLLLFLSALLWWDFLQLLDSKQNSDSLGSTFLTIGKKVTDENMGNVETTMFSNGEIQELKHAPQVQDVGVLTANRFPVYAIFSDKIGFETEMFLEAADEKYLDITATDWQWKPGSNIVPVIISTDFLNIYNYGFALSQGLPQLSEASIKSVAFQLRIGRGIDAITYHAHIAGFSDRINSVLVPKSFIDYGNSIFSPGISVAPSRLIVKAKDPSDNAFINFLKSKNYTTNNELLKWNKLRSIVEVVAASTGGLALIIMSISILVLVLFIELTIAKAATSLSLLLALGYSPKHLRNFMTKQILPISLIAIITALLFTLFVQFIIVNKVTMLNLRVSPLPGWPVWLGFAISVLLTTLTVAKAIKKALQPRN